MDSDIVESNGNGAEAVLRPVQGIDRSHVRSLWSEANRLLKESKPSRLVVDLEEVARIDAAGVALLRELEQHCRREHVDFSVTGATHEVAAFIEFVRGRSAGEVRRAAGRKPLRARFRAAVAQWGGTLEDFIEFIGNFAKSIAWLVTHPYKLRLSEIVFYIQRAGAEGMLLVAALSLLLGIVMAFQGISGMHGFGSPIFVADVVTISTTREMAPLLTGVVVTGRSGAAIAAEIGTMKIDQELDALSVMGFDVMQFLLVPRTLAVAFCTPLLTLLSIAFGIVGGAAVCLFVLHISLANYFTEVRGAITGTQIISALVKGATFGVVIGLTACFQGLQAGEAAEDVGKQTTSAVVKGILLVIFTDAFFSAAGEVYGW